MSHIKFLVSVIVSIFQIPRSLNKLIYPVMLLIMTETYLQICDTTRFRWEAIEYKDPLHILIFLVLINKNPATPGRKINNIHIVHHSNLHGYMPS